MSISKYNSEGYPDPTAFGALSSIENEARALRAFRPIVYICSPFAGDIEKNVVATRTYSRFAVEQGYIIRYSDHYWQESEPGAQAVAHELTRRQLKEAGNDMLEALDKLKNSGAQSLLDSMSKSKAEQLMNEDQIEAYQEFMAAKAYQQFAVKRRDSKNITSTLKESRPMLEISPRDLDADCFALCTPEATYDLRKGMAGAREHMPEDFITKITSVSPNYKGQQIWLDCLDLIFQGNQELIDYVQMICGLAAIGKVYVEALIIAYGDGRNDKSTFWNAISRVLGL